MHLAELFAPAKNDDRTCCTRYYKLRFAALIEDVDDVISKQGYNLVISNTRDNLRMENRR